VMATILALVVLTVLLIGLPLWRLRDAWRRTSGRPAVVTYFGALGAAFMLAEVGLIQRFTIFLGDPAFAVAAVLQVLLVSSGLGSLFARSRRETGRGLGAVVVWIVAVLVVVASPPFGGLLRSMLGTPLPVRIAVSALVIAAVGFPLGMPFPTGLSAVGTRGEGFVPWAWGINGMVSVVASLGSYALGILVGHAALFLIAAGLYGVALAAFRRLDSQSSVPASVEVAKETLAAS
jgi:hypothetical protein